mgnify:CR=1 FL=1
MKNSIEIRQERATAIEKANDLLNLAKNESRDFSADEQVSYDGMMTDIDKMAKDVEVIERQEKLNAEVASTPVSFETQSVGTSKEERSYSFFDAIEASKSGNISGLVKEMDQEARMQNPNQDFRGVGIPYSVLESRAANTGLTDAASPSDVRSFTDDMFAASALVSGGANFYTGLSASQKVPIVTGITAAFQAEAAGANTPAGVIGGAELTPNTIIAATNISNAAFAQNSTIEAAFRRSMAAAIMSEFEKNLLAVADAGQGPTSIFLDSPSAGTKWANAGTGVVQPIASIQAMTNLMITQFNDTNKESVKLLMNGAAYKGLMSEVAGTAGSGISAGTLNLQDRRVLNIPYIVSNNVGNDGDSATKARALMIDMEKIHMAMFGSLDLLVDPYSQALNGGTRIVLSTLLDGLVSQDVAGDKEAGVQVKSTLTA